MIQHIYATGRSQQHLLAVGGMRRNLAQAQKKIATGRTSDTFAEPSQFRHWTTSTRRDLAASKAREVAMQDAHSRIKQLDIMFTRMETVASDLRKSAISTSNSRSISDRTALRDQARASASDLMSVFNTPYGGKYIFGGRENQSPPVEPYDTIVNGIGDRAGFSEVMAERWAADRGASGDYRLEIAASGASGIKIQSAQAQSEFGFVPDAVISSSPAFAISGPSGPTSGLTVDLNAVPETGDRLSLTFAMPGEQSITVTLETVDTDKPRSRTFKAVPGNISATRDNLLAAIRSEIQAIGEKELRAQSAIAASEMFFSAHPAVVPQRVEIPASGDPVALREGTRADTVFWYQGDTEPGSPRKDVSVAMSEQIRAEFGVRANEAEFTKALGSMMVIALAPTAVEGDSEGATFEQFVERAIVPLRNTNDRSGIQRIHVEISTLSITLQDARARNSLQTEMAANILHSLDSVSPSDAAMELSRFRDHLKTMYTVMKTLADTSLVSSLRSNY